jgi:hypothetical protein
MRAQTDGSVSGPASRRWRFQDGSGRVHRPAGESRPGKPAAGELDLYFARQLSFGADAEPVADEQDRKQPHRIRCRCLLSARYGCAVSLRKMSSRDADPAQQVVSGNQRFQPHHLQCV